MPSGIQKQWKRFTPPHILIIDDQALAAFRMQDGEPTLQLLLQLCVGLTYVVVDFRLEIFLIHTSLTPKPESFGKRLPTVQSHQEATQAAIQTKKELAPIIIPRSIRPESSEKNTVTCWMVVDGHNRLTAYRSSDGRTQIPAVIFDGSPLDAVLLAIK